MFINLAEAQYGIKLRVTVAYRSWEEQERLYRYSLLNPNDWKTSAPGGASYHQYGLAFDTQAFNNEYERSQAHGE
jgi:peptidoglycan L-alanyl-D-glutamate endopeptidase CwlK